jgi:Squalene/phytoene synthase
VTRRDLAAGQANPAVRELLAFEIERARAHYQAAAPGIELLAPSSQPCIRAAFTLYSSILEEVERAGYQVLDRRVRVPRHRRLAVAAATGRPHGPSVESPSPTPSADDLAQGRRPISNGWRSHLPAERSTGTGPSGLAASARSAMPSRHLGITMGSPNSVMRPTIG